MAILDKVLNVIEEGVTLGVVDKNLQFHHDLRAVTFADIFGAIHTVYAHKKGPFQAVEDIIAAHHAGTLHAFPDHDQAIAFSRQRGDSVTADRIEAARADNGERDDKTGDNE